VQIEQVNVVGLQLLQTGLHRDVYALCMVALEIGFDLLLGAHGSVPSRELGGQNHFVTIVPLLHPFADPLLRFFTLIYVETGC
jgi:hypothetical protein